jgi:hypothetical protein
MRQRTRVIELIHARANAAAKLSREPRTPRAARPAGASKSALTPARFGPGALIKYGSMDPPKFTLVDEPTDDEFLDLDGPVSADCVAWWNKASIEERCFFMGRAGSLDPKRAYQAYQDALAWAEETKAAERTHQDVVAKARAAKAAAA